MKTFLIRKNSVTIQVYEGERSMTKHNHLLGRFDLTGITPAPRGVPQIDVTFDMDANGILSVSASDKSSGRSNQIRIKNDKGRLSKEEIERMVHEAEKFKHEDEQQRERVAAKNRLETYIFSVKQAINEAQTSRVSSSEKKSVEEECERHLKWLEANEQADKDEFEFHYSELARKCSPIMTKLHQNRNGPTVQEVN
jgi:heat shock protein 1/8